FDAVCRGFDSIHPEDQSRRVGMRYAVAANIVGISSQVLKYDPERLRPREARGQNGEQVDEDGKSQRKVGENGGEDALLDGQLWLIEQIVDRAHLGLKQQHRAFEAGGDSIDRR